MPEGHVTHRAAEKQSQWFAGEKVAVSSPQGRFEQSAQLINGSVLESVQAYGKQLFYYFEADRVVRIHLGLVGKFRSCEPPFPELSPNARMVLWSDHYEVQLTGPNTCELIDFSEASRILDGLGPDPLASQPDSLGTVAAVLSKRKIPIVRALLDQKIIAGLGNIFRSELLFMAGIDPAKPSRELSSSQVECLWELAVTELEAAKINGRVVTARSETGVESSEAAAPSGGSAEAEAVFVYHRDGEPCLRCGTTIERRAVDSRSVWWCPTCQGS